MKKNVVFMILVLLMVTIVGCTSASNDDSSSPGSDSDWQNIFSDDGSLGGDSDWENVFSDSGSLLDNTANSADNIYKSYKEVYRNCSGEINTAVSRFFELFDTDFFDSDAVKYHQNMSYYGSLCSGLENIFSGKDDKIKKNLKEAFYAEDVEWSIDGGTATITFVSSLYGSGGRDADITVTIEYDGYSTAEIIFTVDGEITEKASFVTNDKYNIIAYTYNLMTIIDAVYANGDAYYIYDPGDTSIEFSVYKGSFDDPSTLIGDRQYIAIIDGALVY